MSAKLADLSFTWTTKLDWPVSHSASGQFPPVFSGFSTELLLANPRLGMEEEPILKSTTFWRGDKCLREIPEVARVNQIICGMKLAIWFLRKKEVERQRGKESYRVVSGDKNGHKVGLPTARRQKGDSCLCWFHFSICWERAATDMTGASTALAVSDGVYLALVSLSGVHHSPMDLDLDFLSVTWSSSQVLPGYLLSDSLIAFLVLQCCWQCSLSGSQGKPGSYTAFGLVHQ